MHVPRYALSALFLSVVAALPISAQTIADGTDRDQSLLDGGGRRRQRRRQRRRPPQELRELVRSLEITREQRELARDAAREAMPVVREARERARDLIERARADGHRDPRALRDRLLALRDATRDELRPGAHRLVQSLTTEQRAKLAVAAARHGRTFDEGRLEQRLTRLLAHPRFMQRMHERVEHRDAPRTR